MLCSWPAGMATGELMQLGRKEIASTDLALVRAQKVIPSFSRYLTASRISSLHCSATVHSTDFCDHCKHSMEVVADTIDIGTKTAETLEGQTKQLERVMDDLDEIHFTMKKASQVIRDMTRGMATDK